MIVENHKSQLLLETVDKCVKLSSNVCKNGKTRYDKRQLSSLH